MPRQTRKSAPPYWLATEERAMHRWVWIDDLPLPSGNRPASAAPAGEVEGEYVTRGVVVCGKVHRRRVRMLPDRCRTYKFAGCVC